MRAVTKKTLTSKAALTKTVPAENATSAKKPKRAVKGAPPAKKPAAKSVPPPVVSGPPAWVFPTVPNGFKAPSVDAVRRRSKPTEDMRTEATDFAAELRNGTTYLEDFTKRAPDPVALAGLLDVAVQWDDVYKAAAPIAEYALAMRGAAWDAALKPVNKLKGLYESAVADEPTLAKTWRQTAAFFGAREEPALRAVETKEKAKKAAKKGTPPKT
jgi:hypothetical protein